MLDLVAIAAAVACFHDVLGVGEVGDDAIGAAFCDAEVLAMSRKRASGS
jgi:hypothetical protein